MLSESQFKALIENAHEGIVLYNLQGKIMYSSPAVSKLTGFKTSEVIGRKGTEFISREDAAAASDAFFNLVPTPGKTTTLFQRIRHKKGHYIWAESRLTNLSHIPEINGIVSNFRDITEARVYEENARKTNDLLETINRNLSEAIFMGILQKEFIYVNDAFLNMMGYTSFHQLKRLKPSVIFSSLPEQKRIVGKLKKTLELKMVETLFRRKDGSEFCGVLNVRLLKHEGKGDYFVGTLRNITKEKESERAMIESRNFLDNIINTVAAPIFVKDEENRFVNFNNSFRALLGKSKKALIGKKDVFFRTSTSRKAMAEIEREVITSGREVRGEEQVTIGQTTFSFLVSRTRYINAQGKRFLIGSMTDITHLKHAELEIKRLHENLEGVLESAEESIFSVDQKLRYTAFNDRHKNIMKLLYGANIRAGSNKMDFIQHEPDRKWLSRELKRALRGEHFVTEHYQDFPKYKGYIQATYNPIHDDNKNVKGVAVFVQDITQRKKYEQIINSINANLRAVMESTSDGIVAVDRNFRVVIFNNAYARALRELFSTGISVGANFLQLFPANVAQRLDVNVKKVFAGKQFTIETQYPGGMILETSFNPICDENGGVTGAAFFIRDVTEKKRLDEQLKRLNFELTDQNLQLATRESELESALRELSERNFELDQLMYKTSHDLRSPLSSIIGLINLANIDPDPEAYKQYLSKIEGRAQKLDEFIRSMLDYARVNRLDIEPEEIDLTTFVRSCIAELEYMENSKKVDTRIFVKPRGATSNLDKLRLKIIFSNIISNAYKYLNPDVRSFLRIDIIRSSGNLSLSFKDNGIGIKEEYMSKIFNMFYRATDRSQGSGLGMYIVKQAVEKMGGTISLASTYGKGTSIKITLPINKT